MNVVIAERSQELDEGDWLLQMNPSCRDTGTGMTDPEVDEFNERIHVDAFLACRVAVGCQTREIVRDLKLEALHEVYMPPAAFPCG